MEASEWISLAAVAIAVTGPLIGVVWIGLRAQIAHAHTRLDKHERAHDTMKGDAAALREKLAAQYVKRDDLRERLAEVFEPVHEDFRILKRQMDRMERFQLSLMQRLHIPAVLNEEADS